MVGPSYLRNQPPDFYFVATAIRNKITGVGTQRQAQKGRQVKESKAREKVSEGSQRGCEAGDGVGDEENGDMVLLYLYLITRII